MRVVCLTHNKTPDVVLSCLHQGDFRLLSVFTGSVHTRKDLFSFLRMHLNELLRFAHQEKSRRKAVLEMLPAFLLTRILKLICQFFHHGIILAAQLDRQQRQKALHVP